MKICPHCMEPLKEYVGFASREGDPNNPWDCVNKNCSPKTKKPSEEGFTFETEWLPIPTQSEPDQSSVTPAAKTASSQTRHTQPYPQVGPTAGASGLLPLAPDLSLDDPDQCTLQQQGSDLPPKSGTPKLGYVTLDAETLRASMSNRGAFLPIKKE